MKADRATQHFLNSFSEEARADGERLYEERRVKQIFGNHSLVKARVEEDGRSCRTTLRLTTDAWEGECSCEQTIECASLVATMLERLARGGDLPEAPNEVDEQSLQEILEARLGRELGEPELKFVDKLEKRYRRFELEGQLFDHDLVRLNPRWPVESYDPIELWPTAPSQILEFWNYIAYALSSRNLAYPRFMDVVTDLGEVETSLREWQRERAEEEWRQTVCAYVEPELTAPLQKQFRILVTTSEARIQWSNTGTATFASLLTPVEVEELDRLHRTGALRLDEASLLLVEGFLSAIRGTEHVTLRLENPVHGSVLNRFFHTRELEGRIVNLDEQIIRMDSRPVSWAAHWTEGLEDVVLQLLDHEGRELPHSLRLLPGLEPLYLADECAFPGPPFWGQGTEVPPQVAIPRKVVWTESGVAFLSGIRARLPEALERDVEEVPMRARVVMRLSQKLTGSETEQLLVEVSGSDENGTRKEVLEKDGWIISERTANANGAICRYRREELRRFPAVLEPLGLSWEPSKRCFKTRLTRSFPERFVQWYESVAPTLQVDTDEHLKSLLADPVKATVTFDIVASEIDWFDLKIVVNVEGLNLSANEIRLLVAARGGFVRMKDGGWLRLQIDLTESQADAVRRIGLDPFDLSGETHRLHVLQLAEPRAKEVFDEKAWQKICERADALKTQVTPPVPKDLNLSLRPYQVEGLHFLAYLSVNGFGGILADDMGLGKTVQAIAWLLWLRQQSTEDHAVLVVCPKSVLDVWAGELKKFAPHLRVQILRTKYELDMDYVKEHVDVLVMNYSQLRVNVEKLSPKRWLAMILDEGQQIKNPDSKAAKAARELGADNRLVLTGTPIENRLLDIWSLMAFAMPGVLGSRKYFRDRFDRRKDPLCQERLSARLRPFLLRRTKGQVAMDLPPRTEEDVFCEMDGEQKDMYDAEVERIQRVLLNCASDDEFRVARFTVLQGLTRLRQICCHPALLEPAAMEEESAKMLALFYLLDQLREEGHKVLVFSQFVSMLEIIKARLEEEERPHVILTGKTQNRQEVIEEFQTSKDPLVFLLSLKAGGSGLNLTSASYVVLYDPWWNPAVEAQAIDRTHRIGQENKVIAYRLLMRNSVEEKIRVLQRQKEAVVSGVLGEEGFASTLTRDDLKFLFASDPPADEPPAAP